MGRGPSVGRFPPRGHGVVTFWQGGAVRPVHDLPTVTAGDRVRHVVVVGGGIAGLAAAYHLRRTAGDRLRITVLEAAAEVGGKLRLGHLAGVPVDVGAEALLARRPEGVELARAVGVADRLEPAVTAAAGVWTRGRLRPLPAGHVMGVPTDLRALAASGLLSLRGLARVPWDLVQPARAVTADVSVARYLAARVGREVVDRLVEPLLGGVYAGRADLLSLQATLPSVAAVARGGGPLLTGLRPHGPADPTPVFVGLAGGLGTLPAAVARAAAAQVRLGSPVRALARTPRGFRLTVGSTRAGQSLDADAVVLAVPAAPAARLLADVAPAAAADLAGIGYASVAVVTLAYPAPVLAPRLTGSGFLVPPVDGHLVKAVTYVSRKWRWQHDAAPEVVVLRASVGRFGAEADLQRDDGELVDLVAAEVGTALGVGPPGAGGPAPVASLVTRWGGALPQYAVGHRSLVARVHAEVGRVPGLAVCGAAYDGVGVPACIATGREAADRVLGDLRARGEWAHG